MRVGMEATRIARWFERLLRRAGVRGMDGRSGGDQGVKRVKKQKYDLARMLDSYSG